MSSVGQMQRNAWQRYERLIARMVADQAATDPCVTPNARMLGRISGRSRQLDVLIEARHDADRARRIVVDAKRRKRKIDVKDVEAFLGLMADVEATHGYLISPAGHTKTAERRAQTAATLRIVPLDRLSDFDPTSWPACRVSGCRDGRIFWDGYPELSMKLINPTDSSAGVRIVRCIHQVGKCDKCSIFHVHCTRCGDIFSVPHLSNDDGHQCSCRPPCFWLASVERDDAGNPFAELHVAMAIGQVETVNRRGL